MNCKPIFTLTVFLALVSCGTSSISDRVETGDTLRVGEVRQLKATDTFSEESCGSAFNDSVDCVSAEYIAVGLPKQISYHGQPEVVYGFKDFLLGASTIGAPSVHNCGNDGTLYLFYIPKTEIDRTPDTGSAIDVGDDLIDAAAQRFTINIIANSTGPSLPIYVHTGSSADISCEQIFEGSPLLTINVR